MTGDRRRLRVGDSVLVPWGRNEQVKGRVVEVWGDPPAHVRVELLFDDDDQPVILLPESLPSLAA